MKRNGGLAALCAALALMWMGCGQALAQGAGERRVFTSDQQGFSFQYDSRFTCVWSDEAGAVVYTKPGDAFPRLQLHRTIYGDTTGFAADEYFDYEMEQMGERLGSRLKGVGGFCRYTLAGVEIPGVIYEYVENERDAVLFSLLDDTGESLVKYSCFYYQGESEEPLKALDDAVATYQPRAEADGDTPTPTPKSGGSERPKAELKLAEYDGGFFTVMLPEGWRIQTMGQYNTFGFRAWDAQNPDYQIFYYGKLNPFMKSEAAKAWNQRRAKYGLPYSLCGDTIVVEEGDVSALFYGWNDFAANVSKYTGAVYTPGFSFPSLRNFGVIDVIPVQTYFQSVASAEAIVTGSFQSQNGTNCYAKLCASIVPGMPVYQGGTDLSWMEAYSVSGVLAPRDGFLDVEALLSQAIYSLNFTQAYVDEANEYTVKSGEMAMAANAALQDTYAKYNEAWRSYILEYDLIYIQNGQIDRY